MVDFETTTKKPLGTVTPIHTVKRMTTRTVCFIKPLTIRSAYAAASYFFVITKYSPTISLIAINLSTTLVSVDRLIESSPI